MFIKVGSDYADAELFYLHDFCGILDSKITTLNDKISVSRDPESDGLFDYAEYFIGLGFCAMQRYLIDCLDCKGIKKRTGFELGNKTSSGRTYAQKINSLANWWKHSAEWQHFAYEGEEIKRSKNEQITIDDVLEIAEYPYVFSTALVRLSPEGRLVLSDLIPFLINWRDDIHEYARQKIKSTSSI